MKLVKKCFLTFLAFSIILGFVVSAVPNAAAEGETAEMASPSYILTDSATGTVLLEKNADERRPMASVTKIMTMLITMEEVDKGNLSLSEKLYASANACAMGGSQIFLKENEEMDLKTLIKTVFVASANDSCVVIAERIAGSVEGFVNKMNERAKELGLENTHFENPHGLDTENHYSSARDLAVISRELLKHDIKEYTTIWQDTIRDGAFVLSNTNKLIRFYPDATGLKTGSTSKAGFCISATAKKGNLELIAVTLGAPTSKERFNDAKALLNYGFSKYKMLRLSDPENSAGEASVDYGKEKNVSVCPKEIKEQLISSDDKYEIETKTEIYPVKAPVKKGDTAGKMMFYKNGEEIDSVELVCGNDVMKKSYFDTVGDFLKGI